MTGSNNILTVREFDFIQCKIKVNNTNDIEKSRYIEPELFKELKEFITDCEENWNINGDERTDNILDFFQIGYKKDYGDCIIAKNYVGLVQLESGFQIEILPKIVFNGDENDVDFFETKKVLIKMLETLEDFPCKEFSDSDIDIENLSILEIFVRMFVKDVRRLVKQGLKSSYIIEEENIGCFKGKLLVCQNIKYNICHKERFYMSFDEFGVNRPENKLIKSTLLELYKITDNFENSREIRLLLDEFDEVDASFNHEEDISKVVIDRNSLIYENIIRWVKVFLFGKCFTNFSGENYSKAFLFRMEQIFESYVANSVENNMSKDWSVSVQDSGYWLFDKPKKFRIRPDIVLTNKNNEKIKIILDTKWKRLVDDSSINYGISQSDIYQMYAYSKKIDTPYIWLLYPLNDEMKRYKDGKRIEFIAYKNENSKYIDMIASVFFIDLSDIDNSITRLLDDISKVVKINIYN